MKIGLSFSRCLSDIVDGKVDIDDVLVIIAGTDFDPRQDDQWWNIWDGYFHGGAGHSPWSKHSPDDREKFRSVAVDLWNRGKLHQPRKFGAVHRHRKEHWLETILLDSDLEQNPMAKEAWDHYKTVALLCDIKPQSQGF